MNLTCVKKRSNAESVCVRLILVEDAAAGFEPPRASDASGPTLEVVVLVQSRGEPNQAFLDRALRRIHALERSDRMIVEAIIAAGPTHDDSVLDARLLSARALLAHMTTGGSGEIVLMAGSSEDRVRHELLALAGRLTSESSQVSVRVLFEPSRTEPERKSGIQALLASARPGPETQEVLAAG